LGRREERGGRVSLTCMGFLASLTCMGVLAGSFASYLGAFVGGIRMKEGQKDTVTVTSDQWLVWKFEGECTLESYLAPPNDVNFPYNIEYAVLKKYNDNMEDGA